ncbi:MAG: hypothetical protein M1813_006313 [Trichoglossum hirsutum]|nr:MAG: hypothetical protein M1813_006313 [Trichoglossum hirsutum]
MARLKETPVTVPGRGEYISATSPLSQECLSSSSSGSEASDSDSRSDAEDSDSSDRSSSQDSSGTDTGRRDTATVLPKARPVYQPPHGFQPLSTDPSFSRTSKLLDPANLAGKQIWHITAPVSVPVDALKEVSAQKVMNGEAALSHGGSEYAFVVMDEPATGPSQTILLVPGKEGYRPAGVDFARTLHLRQVVDLPTLTDVVVSAEAASRVPPASAPTRKTVRKQPKGLKMRFTPIGIDSSRSEGIGWSDSDTSEAERENVVGNGTRTTDFRFPNGFTMGHRPEKRKRERLNGGGSGETTTVGTELSPRKKKSKHKHEHKLHSAGDMEPTTSSSPPKDHTSRSRAKKSHKSHTKASAPSAVVENGSSSRLETSQERARRKEKERRRRERSGKTQHD